MRTEHLNQLGALLLSLFLLSVFFYSIGDVLIPHEAKVLVTLLCGISVPIVFLIQYQVWRKRKRQQIRFKIR